MNTNKSVFWGFVSLSVAGFGAWIIERSRYMEEKKKKIEEVSLARQKYNTANNIIDDSTYIPYDETNRKRDQQKKDINNNDTNNNSNNNNNNNNNNTQ